MSTKRKILRAPQHLSAPTRAWWRHVVETWGLEEHHVRLLTLAAEASDRAEQARRVIAERGLTQSDRFQFDRPRPEVAIERDARLAFARLLRELDLDVEAPGEERRRPPALVSNRRERHAS